MKHKTIVVLDIFDVELFRKGLIIIRSFDNSVSMSLVIKRYGDVEIFFKMEECQSVLQELTKAASFAKNVRGYRAVLPIVGLDIEDESQITIRAINGFVSIVIRRPDDLDEGFSMLLKASSCEPVLQELKKAISLATEVVSTGYHVVDI